MDNINWEEIKRAIKENSEQDNMELIMELEKPSSEINEYKLYNRLWAYYKAINKKSDADLGVSLRNIQYALQSKTSSYAVAMQEDVTELNRCYKAGAYKSTLIMAGSILEAFLLDWLSEIDGEDYFDKPYLKRVIGDDGLPSFKPTSSLCDYIDAIAEIQAPEWLDEQKKAHVIRKSRNIVHPKCFLKQDREINKATCEEVIQYLEEIINKRIEGKCRDIEISSYDLLVKK